MDCIKATTTVSLVGLKRVLLDDLRLGYDTGVIMAVSVLLEGRLPSLNSQLVPDISQLLGSASRFAHPSCIRSEHASHFSLRALESWVQVDQIALASACLHNLDGATFLERRRRLIDEVGLFVCLSILCLCCFHVTAHGVHR